MHAGTDSCCEADTVCCGLECIPTATVDLGAECAEPVDGCCGEEDMEDDMGAVAPAAITEDTAVVDPAAADGEAANATASASAVGVTADAAVVAEVKGEAFEEAEMFAVGDPIVFNTELVSTGVVTEDAADPEIREIATDPDFIKEKTENCCEAGSFCCGMELGCLPDALAPDVVCPVRGPDSPQPCCTRRL